METFCEIILDKENNLFRLNEVLENITEQMEFATGQGKITLDKLQKLVIWNGFPDRQPETKSQNKVVRN